MLYKRISNALCLAMCLSMAVMHNVSAEGPKVPFSFNSVLKSTDSFVQKHLRFQDTTSLLKAATALVAVLLIVVPFYRYLTDGRNFESASSDEALAEVIQLVKQKVTFKTLRSLAREVCFKMVRMIRSKLGHHSYLITIKEEKTKNSDGSTTNVLELKTVGATGLCGNIENVAENAVFLTNTAAGIALVLGVSEAIESGDLIGKLSRKKVSWNNYYK